MGIAITIIICIVLLCIIPSIGTRRPRGYQPRVQRLTDPIPPTGGSCISTPSGFGSYVSAAKVDEGTIRSIVREEMAKQNDVDLGDLLPLLDHRLVEKRSK